MDQDIVGAGSKDVHSPSVGIFARRIHFDRDRNF